jgi:gamma-glutamylcyclotransferase (GGCT)/AIG2-like uncharacterized protein YtfP
MEIVFVYGSLRDKGLRKEICGREINTKQVDILKGFDLSSVQDGVKSYPIIIQNDLSDHVVNGEIIELTESELLLIDVYEGSLYRRKKIPLESGESAWVYIQ